MCHDASADYSVADSTDEVGDDTDEGCDDGRRSAVATTWIDCCYGGCCGSDCAANDAVGREARAAVVLLRVRAVMVFQVQLLIQSDQYDERTWIGACVYATDSRF